MSQPSANWLDVASGFFDFDISGTLSSTGVPFSSQQQAMLEELLKKFGECIGRELGTQIRRLANRYDEHMSDLGTRTEKLESRYLDQREAATSQSIAREATNAGSSKTVSRRLRRRKAKRKFEYTRSQLLTVRPTVSLHKSKDVVTLDLSTAIPVNSDYVETRCISPRRMGVAGEFLDRQCRAARCLQSWWRFKTYLSGARQARSLLWERMVKFSTDLVTAYSDDRTVGASADRTAWCHDEPKCPPSAFFLYANSEKTKLGRPPTREELLSIQRGWQQLDADSKQAFAQEADQLQVE